MNRRPSKSRSVYDSFSPRHTARLRIHTPDADFFETRKRKPLFSWLLVLPLIAAALLFLGNYAANQFVHVTRITVPVRGLGAAFDGFTILHLSDLKGRRFGGQQGLFEMAISGKEFDLVVMTGDMISLLGNEQPFYTLLDRLGEAAGDVPIYCIAGDDDPLPASMDYAASGSPFAPWVLGAQRRGAQLLSSPVLIEREGKRIWLTTSAQLSLDLDAMQSQYERQYLEALEKQDENEIELAAYHLDSLEKTRSARAEMTWEDTYIALTHVLPGAQDYGALTPAFLSSSIDLMLGGHYLGGLIRLPGVGPLFVPSREEMHYGILPGDGVYAGLSRRDSTWLYASPGLGAWDGIYPKWFFRLFNPPTVTLITLTVSAL
ncbi:MAG: metallophosphoesterase [Clostridia bacterium]|nr:metallophosphoesterase [Clostridia bacterium]